MTLFKIVLKLKASQNKKKSWLFVFEEPDGVWSGFSLVEVPKRKEELEEAQNTLHGSYRLSHSASEDRQVGLEDESGGKRHWPNTW